MLKTHTTTKNGTTAYTNNTNSINLNHTLKQKKPENSSSKFNKKDQNFHTPYISNQRIKHKLSINYSNANQNQSPIFKNSKYHQNKQINNVKPQNITNPQYLQQISTTLYENYKHMSYNYIERCEIYLSNALRKTSTFLVIISKRAEYRK